MFQLMSYICFYPATRPSNSQIFTFLLSYDVLSTRDHVAAINTSKISVVCDKYDNRLHCIYLNFALSTPMVSAGSLTSQLVLRVWGEVFKGQLHHLASLPLGKTHRYPRQSKWSQSRSGHFGEERNDES
jgi:hypothetical protein